MLDSLGKRCHSRETLEAVLHPDLDAATAIESEALRTKNTEARAEQISIANDIVLAGIEVIECVQEVCSELQLVALSNRYLEVL